MQLDLQFPTLTATPGEPVPCTVTVANPDPREASATLRVLGVPTDAAGFTTLRLPAGRSTTVTFEILMPIGSPGGTHPFQVEVISDSGTTSMARGEVLVRDAGLVHLALSPSGISGSRNGELLVSIHNRGRQPVELALSGRGHDHRIRFKFHRKHVHVSPGERVNIGTKVRSRRPTGGDPVVRQFTVEARGAAVPLQARGTFRQTALFDRNLSKAMAVLLVLAMFASAALGAAALLGRDDITDALNITRDDDPVVAGKALPADGAGGAGGGGAGGAGGGADGEQAGPPPTTPLSPAGEPRVTGFVRDRDGNGLSGVSWTVSPASADSRSSAIAFESSIQTVRGKRLGGLAPDLRQAVQTAGVTGDDGSYTAGITEPGAYYLDFRSVGYQTTKHLVVFGTDMAPVGLDLTMQRATGRIIGRVAPASNARILITDGVIRYQTIADASTGEWEVSDVSVPGEFVVTATLPTGESAGAVASVPSSAAGSAFDVGTLTIRSGLVSLSGVICDESTSTFEGIPGAQVTVTNAGDDASFATTSADASDGVVDDGGIEGGGKFVFNGLPIQDEYDLTVVAEGYVTVTRRFVGTGFQEDCIGLTPATGGLAGTVAFDEEPGPTTSGISIRAVSATDQYVTTVGEKGDDDTGPFAISNMAPGEYVVTVSRPDIATVVRQIQIVPPNITTLDIVVEQVDTDASLSTPVRFLLAGDTGLRSSTPGPEALQNLAITVAGVDIEDILTEAVTDTGAIDQVVPLPLGRHRLELRADGHETVRLPFVVQSADGEFEVDLASLDRSGTEVDFDGELRPLATLETEFVSGLGVGTEDEELVEAVGVLQKVLTATGLEPANGLDDYGQAPAVDNGTIDTITMGAPAETFSLERRLPSGNYVVTVTSDPPDFHWEPDLDEERFVVDLRTTTFDGSTPVGPGSVVFPRFPKFDIVVNTNVTGTEADDTLATAEKVIRTITTNPDADALCADGSLPTADASVEEDPPTAALPTVVYTNLPAPDATAKTITIPERSVEIDRNAPVAATVIVCRTSLEPVVETTDVLEPNIDIDVTLTLNPATVVQLFWDDFGSGSNDPVERTDFIEGFEVRVDGNTLIAVGTGRFQTGELAPGQASSDVVVDFPDAPAYPRYTRLTVPASPSVTGGQTTDIELATRSATELTVPVFQAYDPAFPAPTVPDGFSDLAVTVTAANDPSVTRTQDRPARCRDLPAGAPVVTQCDYEFASEGPSGIGFGVSSSSCISYAGSDVCPGQSFQYSGPFSDPVPSVTLQVVLGSPRLFLVSNEPGTSTDNLGNITLPDGRVLPANDFTTLLRPPVGRYLPVGRYQVEVNSTSNDPRALFAANNGTFDLTPDKADEVRLGDALRAIRRPTLTVDLVDQAGAALPATGDPDLDVLVVQDGFEQPVTVEAGDPSPTFLVDPTDLLTQLATFDSVTPLDDPSGATEVTLVADTITPDTPGPVQASVDLPADGPFEYVDADPALRQVTDTTIGDPLVIPLLRYTTASIAVTGDLYTDPADNPLLPGATVVLTVTFAGQTEPFSGPIGRYASSHDKTLCPPSNPSCPEGIVWDDLRLVDGEATFTTFNIGDNGEANLLFDRIRFPGIAHPGCPPGCSATFAFTATHPEFAGAATATIPLTQGEVIDEVPPVDPEGVLTLLMTQPIDRLVGGEIKTTEGRALVNTAVCVRATPANNGSKADAVQATFNFGYGRFNDDLTWSLAIEPRTRYEVTAAAQTCPASADTPLSGPFGRYTAPAGFDINAKQDGNGQGNGSGALDNLDLLFVALGAQVNGRLDVKHPSADATGIAAFTGCGNSCPTIELFAADDDQFASPIGTVVYNAANGTFQITDATGNRIKPLPDEEDYAPLNPDGEELPDPLIYTDRMYVLRISHPSLVTSVIPIGTLVENQVTTINQDDDLAAEYHPIIVPLRAHTVDITVNAGGSEQTGVQVTLTRTGTDVVSPYVTAVSCTMGTNCDGLQLVPGRYAVTGPSGAAVVGVTDYYPDGDDPPFDDTSDDDTFLDLSTPGPDELAPTARSITVELGFDIDVTVQQGTGTGAIPINGVTVLFGNLPCVHETAGANPTIVPTTKSDGTCTVKGAASTTYTVTVDGGLDIQGGGSYTVDPDAANTHTVRVRAPDIEFSGVDGTVVSVTVGNSTPTCPITDGTCTISLGNNVQADTVLEAVADKDGTASSTTFQWKDARSVPLTALTPRNRTVSLRDSAGTAINGVTVRLTPNGDTGGSFKECFTNANGQCGLSSLWATPDGYDVTNPPDTMSIDPANVAISTLPTANPPILIPLTASAPTVTFTNVPSSGTVTLTGATASGSCSPDGSDTSCPITLAGSVPANELITATLDAGTQVSATMFRWKDTRSVQMPAPVNRTHTLTLSTGDSGRVISAGGAGSCTTTATGTCTLGVTSGVAQGNYSLTTSGGTLNPSSITVGAGPTGSTSVTFTPRTHTLNLTAGDQGLVISAGAAGSCTTTAAGTCTLSPAGGIAPGTYSLTTSGGTLSPGTITVDAGASGSTAVTFTPRTHTLNLTAGDEGLVISAGAAGSCTTTAAGTCTLSPAGGIAPGDYSLTTSGGTLDPSSITVGSGASGSTAVTFTAT